MNKSRKFAALIIITIIFIAYGNVLHAQEDEEHGDNMYVEKPRVFYGGAVAGVNFAQVDGDYFAGYHKIGFNGGGIVYARVARHLAFSMEILYSQKGSKSNIPEPSLTLKNTLITNYRITANYVEVPIMLNYFDKRRSHFGAGISYNLLVRGHEDLEIDSSNVVQSVDLNDKYPFKTSTLDFVAGVDLHLWKGLFMNLRFQYSIVPMRTDIPPDFARAQQYSNLWVFRVMYLLK